MEGRINSRAHQFTQAVENADQKLLEELCIFANDQELSEVRGALESIQWILPRVSQLGFPNVLQMIHDFQLINIDTEYLGKTGLQYACQEGHLDIVIWLLDHGATLQKRVWKEDSELYLSTLNGNTDVVDVLLLKEPDLAADISVRYCLVYAACCGGHVDLMKKWCSAGIDVNETIAFTSDLTNCEQKYPLFAACQGKHLDIAICLIKEYGAAIKHDICYHFPEFTTQLVRTLFLTDMKHKREFCMANYKVECILACWFNTSENTNLKLNPQMSQDSEDFVEQDEEKMIETVIYVQENHLRMLPDGVLWTLRELVSLNVSYNPLKVIPDALDSGSLASNRLKFLTMSHCELTSLSPHIFDLPCLEQLNLSYNMLTTLAVKDGAENAAYSADWKCTRLKSLDISHNLLTSLPLGIRACVELTSLNGSYNELSACSPWQCPMKLLDLSHNKLTTFAPSADQYWKQTLGKLSLQSNQLLELTESIVKMRVLIYLDVSYNKIQRMPQRNLWCCRLLFFNLNDNQLGQDRVQTPLRRVISLTHSTVPRVEFPTCLASTLLELYLSNNDLKTVPHGISDMEKLTVLDLSENPRITELPSDLGKLKNLLRFKTVGITVKDKDLQSLISSLEVDKDSVYAGDIIMYLERKRRNCVRPDVLKIVVLGCKSKNEPCIVQKLAYGKNAGACDQENLTVTRMSPKQRKSLTYEIWEIPDTKFTPAVLPCFLSQNSLYIIIHDASYCGADLHSVSEKVSSIQACVLRLKIIVVCTYTKSMEKSTRAKLEEEIREKSKFGFNKATFVSLTLGCRFSLDSLRQQIYYACESMNDERDIKRQVPKMFLDVLDSVKKLQKDICLIDDFLQVLGLTKQDLDDGIDQNLKLHEFLLQVGAMLHYDIHLDELSDCVILNPTWLFRVLFKFFKSLTTLNNLKIAQLPISAVRSTIQDELPKGDYDYFPTFLKLLETFNIGLRLTDSANKKDELLLVPSLLPKHPPQFQLDAHKGAFRAARLYCLSAVSPAMWSHIISQLILAFDRFSSSKWKLGEQRSNASVTLDRSKSFRMGCTSSLKGLNISNKNIQYWRTGIMMHYDQGHVVVEQVACISSDDVTPDPGILVTVQTTGSINVGNDIEDFLENTKKLSVMGIVRDELEEVLEHFNPKFKYPGEMHMLQIYALCPLCYQIKPTSGFVNMDQAHFKVRDCAQMILSRDAMVCPKGPTLLAHLVPEFLFLELPQELHILAKDIELSDTKLGHGMAGAVKKGTYKGTDVAVKIFHDSKDISSFRNEDDGLYPNVAPLDVSDTRTVFSRKEQDDLETEQIKISNAFSDVRREVGILSKLKHEFIVTFIGICARPHLLLIMELAPLGSLRKELEMRIRNTHSEINNSDVVISQMIFSKDLTHKIILQVGQGLSYLHKNSIVYRDLKPDNILVFSLCVSDHVNIKLSDYGISKFVSLQGVTGLQGTAGYMGPEVRAEQPYTEKADIYSYAIVMFEVLTGIPPSERLHKLSISKMSAGDVAPSHIQGRKIHCNFPYLEYLMKECWNSGMDERPAAETVVKRMKADQFLLLHDSVWLNKDNPEKLKVTCIYACQTFNRWNIWISEIGSCNHRYFSVYDVESCSFLIQREQCDGPEVTHMTKIASRIWIVCKGLDCLQLIVRGAQNKFEIYQAAQLEARATNILHHSLGNTEESKSFILLGLENGCVTVCQFNTCHKKSVTVTTTIELCRDVPVTQLCSVNADMIAVACGMAVYFLHVHVPNICEPTETNKKSVFIPELVNCGCASLINGPNVYDQVISMVAEGSSVWCCLEISCQLVKVDVDSKKVMLIVTLSWESIRDTVMLEEIGIEPSQCTREASEKDLGCESSRKEQMGNESVSDTPPIPPRVNPEFMRKTDSLPRNITDRPPPIPKRAPFQELGLGLTSLALSVDTLIVGTSCGGIILLPLTYKNRSDTSGCLPTLPFSLPMLRHPAVRKELKTRSKSFTATISDQGPYPAGSVIALTLANGKLVSLHGTWSPFLRDSKKDKQASDNRKKITINAEILNSPSGADSSSANNCCGLNSEATPVSKSTQADQMQLTEVADIAIWDEITQNRLNTLRSYGHEFFKCSGWCCYGPARSSKSSSTDETF
ncbi:hypothetical protein BsWGS_00630 [Bradybaena similaris]